MEIFSEKCMIPCKGLYADISVDNSDVRKLEGMKKFGHLIKSYESYKRNYSNDIKYPPALKGKIENEFINDFKTSSGFKKKQRLHFVQISFATPSFDRIIKDQKANLETKLSTIGGTMGLLTGFSIISVVEIIYFAYKILIRAASNVKSKGNSI